MCGEQVLNYSECHISQTVTFCMQVINADFYIGTNASCSKHTNIDNRVRGALFYYVSLSGNCHIGKKRAQ